MQCDIQCTVNSAIVCQIFALALTLAISGPVVCKLCGKDFPGKVWNTRLQNLKKHINSVHLKLKPFPCPKCGQSFPAKQNLQNHYRRRHLHKAEDAQQAARNLYTSEIRSAETVHHEGKQALECKTISLNEGQN